MPGQDFCEADLYAPVRDHFIALGFDVKGEVRNCDVVAVKDDILVSVELKKTFGLKLVYQGLDKQASSDLVYLAIPAVLKKGRGKRSPVEDMKRLCRRTGLGLLEVYGQTVQVLCEAEPTHARSTSARRKRILKEFRARSGDHNIGGTTGVKRVTAFIENSVLLALLAREDGSVTPAKGREAGVETSSAILSRNHLGWFSKLARGEYALTEEGMKGLQTYAHVVETQTTLRNA